MLVSGITSLAQVEHDVVAGRFAKAAAKVAIAGGRRHPVTGSDDNGIRHREHVGAKSDVAVPGLHPVDRETTRYARPTVHRIDDPPVPPLHRRFIDRHPRPATQGRSEDRHRPSVYVHRAGFERDWLAAFRMKFDAVEKLPWRPGKGNAEIDYPAHSRSEERRVGKAWVGTFRLWGSPSH